MGLLKEKKGSKIYRSVGVGARCRNLQVNGVTQQQEVETLARFNGS